MNCELDGKASTTPKPSDKVVKLPPIQGLTPPPSADTGRPTTAGEKTPAAEATQVQKEKFPITTAQLIGWKSTKPEYQLEKYGRYAQNARGRIGIFNALHWPQQGV